MDAPVKGVDAPVKNMNAPVKNMDATIKDIARKAKVSYATVSRALNHRYGVKRETRERVLEAASALNYSPNALARGLVSRRTLSMGLLVPDITNPFFAEVARGVEDGAQEAGYSIFLCNANWDRSREERHLALLAEKRVDGIIMAPVADRADAVETGLPAGIPLVYVNSAPRGTENSYVVIDNVRGGCLAVQHLIDAGYQTIGFIGASEDSATLEERLAGFRLAMRRNGRDVEESFIQLGDFHRETGYHIIQDMIQAGRVPRAVFCENDLLALGVMQGARDKGLAVPEDLAIVGFDDIPLASYPEIRMSTVCQPKCDMGRMAVGILLDKLAADDPGAVSRRILLEPELVVRRSS